jgi:hypothetical protein
MRGLVVVLSVVLALGACKGKEKAAAGDPTATIAPAQPQPGPTGTDAMTQTVELGDGRSVSEGGALTEGAATDTIVTSGTTNTSTGAAPAPASSTTTR